MRPKAEKQVIIDPNWNDDARISNREADQRRFLVA